jgi:hypothetical protein
MAQIVSASSPPRALGGRLPLTLLALFLPAALFGLGLLLVREHPRFAWLSSLALYPWEFWVLLTSGLVATAAGVLDWRYHRSGKTAVGRREHSLELTALAGGGLPLFALMGAASVVSRPLLLLIPVLVVVLWTAVLICYDEFVFHRKRCGTYETILHRLLVFGNGIAWLAWSHWCFVRGGVDG